MKQPPTATFRVDAKRMAELMATVAKFMEGEEGHTACTVEVRGDEKPVKVTAKRADGQVLEALIMPLSK